jgi:hypothetical protein
VNLLCKAHRQWSVGKTLPYGRVSARGYRAATADLSVQLLSQRNELFRFLFSSRVASRAEACATVFPSSSEARKGRFFAKRNRGQWSGVSEFPQLRNELPHARGRAEWSAVSGQGPDGEAFNSQLGTRHLPWRFFLCSFSFWSSGVADLLGRRLRITNSDWSGQAGPTSGTSIADEFPNHGCHRLRFGRSESGFEISLRPMFSVTAAAWR